MSLMERLKAQIAHTGPLTVAEFMAACLFDPEDGYYATRPSLGEHGDFITAPLVSQMFGELIGLWCAETWLRLGRPARVVWVEVGPGDGTLMADALRACRMAPDFLAAGDLCLVEPSAPLRERQAKRLSGAPLQPRWVASVAELPTDAPVVLVANEVLDCLPVRQFVRAGRGWAERRVGVDDRGDLAFGLTPALPPRPVEALEGAVLEVSPAQEAFGAEVGGLVARQGGAALLIDYGRAEPGFGDTLQALRAHEKVSPLQAPGETDLTVHADFPAVLAAAVGQGACASPIVAQGDFLRRLGIEARAAALAQGRPDKAGVLARQLDRLIGEGQMGTLFKAACVHSKGLLPPGFEEDQPW